MRIFGRRRAADTVAPAEPVGLGEPAGQPTDRATAEPPPEPAETLRLLVVDDDEDLRPVMARAMTQAGFEVTVAADGAEAVELASQTQPDLVLLDLHLPEVGGLELIPVVGELAPRARVVIFSTINASYMVEAGLAAGAHGFVVKGVSARSIARHLRRVAESGAVKVVRPYPLNRDYPEG